VPLGTLWNSWSHTARLDILKEIINIEAKLASLSFAKHGCIYFREDLERKGLTAEEMSVTINETNNSSGLSRYALGPLTQASLWEAERAQMSLDRGPCKKYMRRST